MKDFGKVMQWTNRWRDEGWNKTLLTYTFANGSTIEFFSADQEAKLRGARRQVLYINEANNIDFEAYHQLAIRTSEAIYIDFNPVSEFWAHTEVLAEQDSELIVLTYRDNEALPATIRDDIEAAQVKAATSTYWANWWKVYGLGEVGSLQGVVLSVAVSQLCRARKFFRRSGSSFLISILGSPNRTLITVPFGLRTYTAFFFASPGV